MGLNDLLRRLAEPLAPAACAACGLPGEALCRACRRALVGLGGPRCARCGHPWPEPAPRCRACVPGLPASRAAVAYDARAAAAVRAVKDARRQDVALALAGVVAAHLAPPSGHALVPVPAGPARLAERGIDPAAELARALGRLWDLPVAEVLRRPRDGPRQRGASRHRRLTGVRGAFAASGDVPANCCLVDDVHTTGATLAEAARALRSAGARAILAVTVARTLLPESGSSAVISGFHDEVPGCAA